MVVMNGMSRYHLAAEALRRAAPGSRARDRVPTLLAECEARIASATAYAREHLEDPPEIRDWRWSAR
jgi:xylulose-5-phosphate/fructose-6-phosphate phosphoketolase